MDKMNLSGVERASRYIGGEIGSRMKDLSGIALRMALIFPDLYDIGMSSTGFQVLYQIANERDDVFTERAFTPWPDYIAELRRNGERLSSLETHSPIADFDLVLFSLQYELACTNVLLTLDLSGIPRRAEHRGEGDPIVLGGGYCASNPEPWGPFFDALVIGDGEDVLREIIDLMAGLKGSPRAEKMKALRSIAGIHFPSDYKPLYQEGRFAGFQVREGVSPTVRRVVADLDAVPSLTNPILPNAKLVHDRLAIEIMRGCTRGCRFCQPGFLNRPLRERSVGNLISSIQEGLDHTGYDEVTLLSLSSGDYSRLPALMTGIDKLRETSTVSVSLPSLRAESVTQDMMAQVAKVRRSSVTIAPEAGTERLRRVLNKPITDNEILSACAAAKMHGIHTVKLYFMIGLPGETREDIEAIGDLCFRILSVMRQGGGRAQINASVGIFVPKPFTPFAWEAQIGLEEAKARIAYLESRTRGTRVKLKGHIPEMSYIEGIIGRGDRRLADVIERVADAGGAFDGWTEGFSLQRWLDAFASAGVLPEEILNGYEAHAPLPWDSVNALIDKNFLLEERRKAHLGELTDDCRAAPCVECGTCDHKTILNRLAEENDEPLQITPRKAPPARPSLIQHRYRVRFAKKGGMRYLGHLELVSLVHRALHRAGFPLAYSQGFHQLPRVAFGPPLSVGIESLDEYCDVLLTEYLDDAAARDRLSEAMPRDLPVLDVRRIEPRAPSLFNAITGAHFQAFLEDVFASVDECERSALDAVERFRSAASWPVEIERKGRKRTRDAKEFISDLSALPGGVISMKLRFSQTGGLNPMTALASLLNLSEESADRVRWLKLESYFEP